MYSIPKATLLHYVSFLPFVGPAIEHKLDDTLFNGYIRSQESPRHFGLSRNPSYCYCFHLARNNPTFIFFSRDSRPSTCFFSSFATLSATYAIRTALEPPSPLSIIPIVSLRSRRLNRPSDGDFIHRTSSN
ncbi:hypothetical protein K443DRAFT_175475 [Laccaria amethystina LaAM-08-1]|uniref:Uncharacterized protein n=1 Tax=Laccaria amethystina LaAM-08-1 TaxID=1095629 RepID=A0A0C9XCN1_9AGAR|nr:hypothetical protein K443DRAFT_175475 [Laccaria amethystina LaAM-08-1]